MGSFKFCKNCDKNVGLKRKGVGALPWVFLVLGLIVPFWPITLPFFWIIGGIIYFFRSGKQCAVCGAPGKYLKRAI